MNPLRSKSRLTKTLFLLEVVNQRHSTLKTIAQNLDITTQAVSDYFHQMNKEGYMEKENDFYVATNQGMHFLQENLLNIKSFVDEKLSNLSIIRTTTAIAADKIEKGSRVFLFMNDGLIFATKKTKSPSFGTAATDCDKGSVLRVENLEGIMDMKQGMLTFIDLSISNINRKISKADVKALMDNKKDYRVALLDLEAIALFKSKKLAYNYEFASLSLIRDRLQRGLDVLCFGTVESINNIKNEIFEFNKRSNYGITHNIIVL
ncbi:hypothetical protein [[Eubacterium] cellulosolvens]